jgi:hypothetical protein
MTTKTSTASTAVTLTIEDQAVAARMKVRAEARKGKKLVFPPLMAML